MKNNLTAFSKFILSMDFLGIVQETKIQCGNINEPWHWSFWLPKVRFPVRSHDLAWADRGRRGLLWSPTYRSEDTQMLRWVDMGTGVGNILDRSAVCKNSCCRTTKFRKTEHNWDSREIPFVRINNLYLKSKKERMCKVIQDFCSDYLQWWYWQLF